MIQINLAINLKNIYKSDKMFEKFVFLCLNYIWNEFDFTLRVRLLENGHTFFTIMQNK